MDGTTRLTENRLMVNALTVANRHAMVLLRQAATTRHAPVKPAARAHATEAVDGA